ncbi:MAG: hypothetical protein LBE81_01830 [Azonexus sp.]|jgi:hypothetical protein|uniref:hypothetical protein n=1 Tax=Azonexus sp. TaxID=1872668 RepID=UPI0028222819|nr:hypothetical protein [Azonexus sp.]MDR0775365.1 hypothetical protein [Azonexus sp.]
MTSARLISTTERYAQTASERALVASELRRVEAAEAIAGDRKRSLREELNEAENDVGGQARENAHRVATQLAELPPEAQASLTKPLPPNGFCVVDEQA